jgi:type IV pilus assembly protein PilC
MPKYAYRAVDPRGVRISGELEASDPDAVVSQLTAQGCRIESVEMLLTASDVRAEADAKTAADARVAADKLAVDTAAEAKSAADAKAVADKLALQMAVEAKAAADAKVVADKVEVDTAAAAKTAAGEKAKSDKFAVDTDTAAKAAIVAAAKAKEALDKDANDGTLKTAKADADALVVKTADEAKKAVDAKETADKKAVDTADAAKKAADAKVVADKIAIDTADAANKAVAAKAVAEKKAVETSAAARKAADAKAVADKKAKDEPASRLSASEAREIGGHIAEVVSAGLPLEGGLAAVAEEFPGGRVRRALLRIVRKLEAGNDLESALAASGAPGYLPVLVRAGKRTGKTAEILEGFIAGSQSVSELRQTMWMAVAYPLVLLLFTVPLGMFLVFWLVPEFGAIFDGFGVKLPFLTEGVLATSRFLADHGGKTLAVVAAAVLVLYLFVRLLLGPLGTRRMVCGIPVVGSLLRWLGMARFCPVLSLLIESRVPLDEALVLAGDASGDVEIREDCRGLVTHLQSGQTLETAARQTGRFPKSFVKALSWERHQEGFPEVLQSMSEMYAGRARALVAVLIAVLPPLVVTGIVLVVGVILIAMFMPLIELLNKLS